MYLPNTTYRLQVNSSFPLTRVKELIPYLNELGISTLYSAPFFTAIPGSTHGYDGTDPSMINPEIGTLEEAREINVLLKANGMGWIQDIVPNHMAYHSNNVWLMDLFEKGPKSMYANSFDIDWSHPDPGLKGKVLSPFLGEDSQQVIEKGDFQIEYHNGQFYLIYFSLRYPLNWISYSDLLNSLAYPEENESFTSLLQHLENLKLEMNNESFLAHVEKARRNLQTLFPKNSTQLTLLQEHLEILTSNTQAFKEILHQQYFYLTHYSQSDTVINFRRFFVIDQLICLRVEEKEVFDRYHAFTNTLLKEKLIDGLRIDHIDGLFDPKRYLERLREIAGKDAYIIVEKILDKEEDMPNAWPIEGTSGYEFLSGANHLFTKQENKEELDKIYQDFIGFTFNYDALVREKKCYMLEKRMGGELDNLLALLEQTDGQKKANLSKALLREGLFQWLVSFPVYRTYLDQQLYTVCDQAIISLSLQKARDLNPQLYDVWHLFERLFNVDGMKVADNLKFYLRLQQFTGPLAAKGVEDTTFYVYNRLISHNEVGDSPKSFGISTEEFHARMKQRQEKLPFSLNTLSTHDTKRGEDARTRINMLSELPEEWGAMVLQWKKTNRKHKTMNGKEEMPVANDEYFIYQSLLGSFPMEAVVTEEFITRLKDFQLKALREAKVYTDHPFYNTQYEEATLRFCENIVKDETFMAAFLPFFTKISNHAILLSLSQTLMKNTAPGIPDTYQGCELWELSLVDPDNRRTVDFDYRLSLLKQMQQSEEVPDLLKELIANKRDGRVKFYLTWHTLNTRRKYPSVFHLGEYLPLEFKGKHSSILVGFARHFEERWVLSIFPRESSLSLEDDSLQSEKVWEKTDLLLPEGAPLKWENILTKQPYETTDSTLNLNELLQLFPVALLVNRSS